MDILFICGSAEIGNDGVGDYTRRLSGKLIKEGHKARILALCDETIYYTSESQVVENTTVMVHRIPADTNMKQRLLWLQAVVKDFEPDLISLQYVPYSFNPKGLPFWLPSYLKKIRGNHKWHVMFHELWLGIDTESSLKHKCIGQLQQLIAKKIIQNTKTHFVNTQNKLYQHFLRSHNINAEILPICGNIPLTALKKESREFVQFVLFGTIHNGAPFEDFIEDLMINSSQFIKPIKFVFIGKNGTELTNYTAVLDFYNIRYEVLGIQPEEVISEVLRNSDFGISTTPYFQSEKSGVYAAYKEHQINSICVSRNWTPSKGQYEIPQIIRYEKNNLNIVPVELEAFNLNNMASQFINSISVV
ncbi:glycosyltransferase [Flavobacterium olei]|uniref:glycosyltransferase n=1 Tax=Flavobacterium olei TaxID=1886782 RepID=UPI00321BB716